MQVIIYSGTQTHYYDGLGTARLMVALDLKGLFQTE